MGVHTNASMTEIVQNEPSGSFCMRIPFHFGIILYERSLELDNFLRLDRFKVGLEKDNIHI